MMRDQMNRGAGAVGRDPNGSRIEGNTVDGTVQQIGNLLEEAQKALVFLGSRVARVTRPPANECGEERQPQSTTIGVPSELNMNLMGFCAQIRAHIGLLEDLANRIDL